MKPILKRILFALLRKAAEWTYDYIDSNDDGKIDKQEIEDLVSFLRNYTKMLKRKI